MKTAVSLPDSLYREAERYARGRGISRSELYRRALESYLSRESEITEQLNEIYAEHPSRLDPVLEGLQYRSLEDREEG